MHYNKITRGKTVKKCDFQYIKKINIITITSKKDYLLEKRCAVLKKNHKRYLSIFILK